MCISIHVRAIKSKFTPVRFIKGAMHLCGFVMQLFKIIINSDICELHNFKQNVAAIILQTSIRKH